MDHAVNYLCLAYFLLQVFHCVHFETPSQEAKLAVACSAPPSNPDILVVPASPREVDLSPRPSVDVDDSSLGARVVRMVASAAYSMAGAPPTPPEGSVDSSCLFRNLVEDDQDTPESERQDIEEECNNSDTEGR